LVAHQDEVVTRRDLLTKVWGYVNLPTTRTVDNHIARLRKKVEDEPDNPKHILTIHGIGYRFVTGREETPA
ncbi:MAG: winged helix-turn-helix domain-containing protein, partial [Candidatus Hydrogenedentes bacterium]|nr:winged helix-turn-helix domain-containing protein [Candidatus Hydrogenedentota bacterium]